MRFVLSRFKAFFYWGRGAVIHHTFEKDNEDDEKADE